ncbi:MAG: hypothetical protein EXR08_02690 [Alphaproteobacteria bacterium]|nr:hypothetical protein [Alphaproteobacteria bacterium]
MKDLPRSAQIVYGAASIFTALLCLYSMAQIGRDGSELPLLVRPLMAGVTGSLALALIGRILTEAVPPLPATLGDALVIILLALSISPDIRVWQAPAAWHEFLMLSEVGAVTAVIGYFGVVIWGLARRRHPPANRSLFYLLAPVLFNMLLGLGTDPLLAQLGGVMAFGGAGQDLAVVLGRALMLFLFNLVLFSGVGVMMDRRWTSDMRVLGLLLLVAIHASLGPLIADMISGAAARMMSAAYALLGIDMKDGQLRLGAAAISPASPIQRRKVIYLGKELESRN